MPGSRPTSKDILPPGFAHPDTGETEFVKETDIFDVWFDSGSTCRTVLEQWPGLSYPADVYLEGGDQHRGWFNSSLMIGVATKGAAPYRQVVTNGWTLDESGRKMSKSAMNGVAPQTVVEKYGADVLRLWVCSTDYFGDVRVGDKILDQTATSYRTLRNTLRFTLGNLYDFDPVLHAVPLNELEEIDRWAMHRLNEVVHRCTQAYDVYEFPRVAQTLLSFCSQDLSAFYLDVLKDRLYAFGANSPSAARPRRSCSRSRAAWPACSRRSCRSPPRRSGRSCPCRTSPCPFCWPPCPVTGPTSAITNWSALGAAAGRAGAGQQGFGRHQKAPGTGRDPDGGRGNLCRPAPVSESTARAVPGFARHAAPVGRARPVRGEQRPRARNPLRPLLDRRHRRRRARPRRLLCRRLHPEVAGVERRRSRKPAADLGDGKVRRCPDEFRVGKALVHLRGHRNGSLRFVFCPRRRTFQLRRPGIHSGGTGAQTVWQALRRPNDPRPTGPLQTNAPRREGADRSRPRRLRQPKTATSPRKTTPANCPTTTSTTPPTRPPTSWTGSATSPPRTTWAASSARSSAPWQKIEDGTYGLSDMDGTPIPVERLEALPYALTTVEQEDAI